MKLRNILIYTMVAIMCLTYIPAMAEETPVTVMVDGEYVKFDVQPTIIEGRTLVPVRAIFEALGAEVDWNGDTRTAVSSKGDTKVSVQIDNSVMKVNDADVVLDVPAQLIDNRTLVPVRAISEAYDCYVDWNGDKRTVIVVSDLAKTEIMKVNDISVSAGYFNYCMYLAQSSIAENLGTTVERISEMWNTSLGDITFSQYISDIAADQVVMLAAAAGEAKKQGLKLEDEDIAFIEENLATLRKSYEQEAEYFGELEKLGTSEDALRAYLTDSMYMNKLYEKFEDQYGMKDAEIKKYLDDNYVQAQHILISTDGLDDEQKAEKLKLAKTVLSKAKSGADFDALVKEYGEDPGMEANPEGYLFTKGEMVPEFETAAFALKVGKISNLVETTYGYHIIKRVKSVYTDEIIKETRTALVADKVYSVFGEYVDSATVTRNDNMFAVITPVGV